jgi:hypothetical protein
MKINWLAERTLRLKVRVSDNDNAKAGLCEFSMVVLDLQLRILSQNFTTFLSLPSTHICKSAITISQQP